VSSRCICVYCGSSLGNDPIYRERAVEVGEWIARSGHSLVYGGGKNGLMGVVADAVLAQGGKVTGVIPEFMVDKEVAHRGLSELKVVPDMHVRKATMARLADAFVALPGSTGTLEEIAEVFVWSQLGVHFKPCGLLNVKGYFDPLVEFIRRMGQEGFMPMSHIDFLKVHEEVNVLLPELLGPLPPLESKYPITR
jgi:uncharacterized protein (TIGR00730 family)